MVSRVRWEPRSDSPPLSDCRAWTPCPRAWKTKDSRLWFSDTIWFSDTQIALLCNHLGSSKTLMSGLIPRNFNATGLGCAACTSGERVPKVQVSTEAKKPPPSDVRGFVAS